MSSMKKAAASPEANPTPTEAAAPATKGKADKQLHGAARDAKLKADIRKEMTDGLDSLGAFISTELEKAREDSDKKFEKMLAQVTAPAAKPKVGWFESAGIAANGLLKGLLNAPVTGDIVTPEGYLVRKSTTVKEAFIQELANGLVGGIKGAGHEFREFVGVDVKGHRLAVIDADEDEGWGWQEYGLAAVGTAAASGAAYGGYRMLSARGGMDLEDDNVLPYAADGGV